jgi:hypothetical protein
MHFQFEGIYLWERLSSRDQPCCIVVESRLACDELSRVESRSHYKEQQI